MSFTQPRTGRGIFPVRKIHPCRLTDCAPPSSRRRCSRWFQRPQAESGRNPTPGRQGAKPFSHKQSWTAAGNEAPRRFESSDRIRKAVSPLRSATALQNSHPCAFAFNPTSQHKLRHGHEAFRFQPALFIANRKQPERFFIQTNVFVHAHARPCALLEPRVTTSSNFCRRYVFKFHTFFTTVCDGCIRGRRR